MKKICVFLLTSFFFIDFKSNSFAAELSSETKSEFHLLNFAITERLTTQSKGKPNLSTLLSWNPSYQINNLLTAEAQFGGTRMTSTDGFVYAYRYQLGLSFHNLLPKFFDDKDRLVPELMAGGETWSRTDHGGNLFAGSVNLYYRFLLEEHNPLKIIDSMFVGYHWLPGNAVKGHQYTAGIKIVLGGSPRKAAASLPVPMPAIAQTNEDTQSNGKLKVAVSTVAGIPLKPVFFELRRGNEVIQSGRVGDKGSTEMVADAQSGVYLLQVRADGYKSEEREIIVSPDTVSEISIRLLTLSEMEVQQGFDFGQISFEPNSSVLTSDSTSILSKIVQILTKNPSIQVFKIDGHTDSSGILKKNMEISQARAESVRTHLIENGIAASRLKATGYGPTKPLTENSTAIGRAKNRRVEFIIGFSQK